MLDPFDTPQARRTAWSTAAARAYLATPAGATACRQGFVLTPAQAVRAGVDKNDVRRLVRGGTWTAVRRNAVSVLPRSTGRERVHGDRPEIAAAAVALLRPDTAISHECAALARGLDVYRVPCVATLTIRLREHTFRSADTVIRAADLHDIDLDRWYGAPITTCARTVIDLARQGARSGIIVADCALREGLVTRDQLVAAADRARRWDGIVTARRVLELAGPKSESALESLCRLFLAEHHVPLPEQQCWIETHRGAYRVDGLWERERVVLEVDGLTKYHRGPDALIEEKLRQEALERAGYIVVRVTWRDIHSEPEATLARIWSALARRR
jgi:very-short-patch-repair endonuclease